MPISIRIMDLGYFFSFFFLLFATAFHLSKLSHFANPSSSNSKSAAWYFRTAPSLYAEFRYPLLSFLSSSIDLIFRFSSTPNSTFPVLLRSEDCYLPFHHMSSCYCWDTSIFLSAHSNLTSICIDLNTILDLHFLNNHRIHHLFL